MFCSWQNARTGASIRLCRRQIPCWRRFALLLLIVGIAFGCVPGEKQDGGPPAKRGQKAFEQGRYDQAIEAWNQALKADPGNGELALKIATAFQKQGRFEDSIRLLRRITSGDHAPLEAYVMLVQNLIMLQDFEKAETVFESIKKLQLADYRLLILEGDCKTMTARLQEGEVLYRKAIAMQNETADAYFKLAANLVAQNRAETADSYYRQALSLDNDRTTAFWLHKAEFLTLKGAISDAEFALQEALKSNPDSLFIRLKTAQLYKVMQKYGAIVDLFTGREGLSGNEVTRKIVVEALLNNDELDAAHAILNQHAHSVDPDWLLMWGKYHLLIGYSANAVSYIERALEQKEDDPEASYLLALAYMAANKFNLAQRTLIRLLTLVPNYPDAVLALTDIYYKKGNYDLSIDHLNRVIAGNPGNFRAYLILGNCLIALGQFEAAELNFRKALKLNDKSFDARFFLSMTTEKQGLDGMAIRLLEKVLEENPHKVDALLKITEIYMRNRKPEAAVAVVEALVEAYPKNSYLQVILGRIHQANNDPDQAIHFYMLALKNNPKLDAIYENIIGIEKNNQKKIDLLLEANRTFPQSFEIKIMLADLYLQEGEIESATEIMERLYCGDKTNPFFANNLAWLYLENDTRLIQAFELASAAYEADAQNAYFAHTIGVAYHKKGLLQQAEWYLRQALVLTDQKTSRQHSASNHESIFHYHMALLLLDADKPDEARKMLQSVLEGALPARYADTARKVVENQIGPEDAGTIVKGEGKMRIDHIGIAVKSLDVAIEHWHIVFGYDQMTDIIVNSRQKVRVVFLCKENSINIKLIEPLDETSPIFRFAKRGGGLHHLCFKCNDIGETLVHMEAKGLRVLSEPQPGEAFGNEKIAFLYAKQGLNIELIDTDKRAGRR